MKLIIEPSGDWLRPWAVRGEDCNFYVTCHTVRDARLVARWTQRDFARNAEIIDFPDEHVALEEKAMHRDWKNSQRSDWNE